MDQDDNAQVVEGGTPTQEPGPTPTPQEGGAEETSAEVESAETAGGEASKGSVPEVLPQWMQRRINKEVGQRKALEERLRVAEAALEASKTKPTEPPPAGTTPPAGGLSEDEVERRAAAKAPGIAQALAQKAAFNAACNKVLEDGMKAAPDFKDKLINIHNNLGDLPDEFLEGLLETGEQAHKVLYALGKDLDEASRILSLPAKRQVAELTKLALKLEKAPAEPSKAPKPPATVGGRSGAPLSLDDPNISMEKWIELRNKQVAEKKRA